MISFHAFLAVLDIKQAPEIAFPGGRKVGFGFRRLSFLARGRRAPGAPAEGGRS